MNLNWTSILPFIRSIARGLQKKCRDRIIVPIFDGLVTHSKILGGALSDFRHPLEMDQGTWLFGK